MIMLYKGMLWLYYAYVVAAATWRLHWSNSMIMLYKGMLWIYYAYVVAAAMAALPARREETCLWFLWLLISSSSFALATLGSMISKTNRKTREQKSEVTCLPRKMDHLEQLLTGFMGEMPLAPAKPRS